ncbi:MAG: 3-dehydroquinate synthase [Verrucomicrobiales bacterium]|nr:3-dehydroquinate synthase [Verrucomicrobiales bacterium]
MPDSPAATALQVHVDLADRSYDVQVGPGLIDALGDAASLTLPGRRHAALISESQVAPLYADRTRASLMAAGVDVTQIVVPEGEASKDLAVSRDICSQMAAARLDRKGFVVALGGGVIGDLAGFCAAMYQRGIPYIQVPTTILSQVDSSVGGKTGVNLPEAKNMVGAFHQPAAVLADTDSLKTLGRREWNEGFAEIIKHACIRDAAMFPGIDAVAAGRMEHLPELIRRNIAIKARIVEADEHETRGLRSLLNFGHTLGHAIEAAAGYGGMLHGEAISLGLRAAAFLSVQHAGLPQADAQRIERTLAAFDLPLVLEDRFSTRTLMDIAARDKKFEQGAVRFVLLRELGDAFVSADISASDMDAALDYLRTPVA